MELVYVLLWVSKDCEPFCFPGTDTLHRANCTNKNCYITRDREYFGSEINKFDAVLFNGKNLDLVDFRLYSNRSVHQKFIFVMTESASYYPVYDKRFDSFFNWTMTYRLDSVIPFRYFDVKDENGTFVGPQPYMHWKAFNQPINKSKPINESQLIDKDIIKRIQNKTKAAAWFLSTWDTKSRRENCAKNLSEALIEKNQEIDIFGSCDPFDSAQNCTKQFELLERDYFFYLAFEDCFSEDYVTDTVLNALQHYAVPIVYGEANYTRFLPPGSYLNARDYSAPELADIMFDIMQNFTRYQEFFQWRSAYTYHSYEKWLHICDICDALNDIGKLRRKSGYRKFRLWWNECDDRFLKFFNISTCPQRWKMKSCNGFNSNGTGICDCTAVITGHF